MGAMLLLVGGEESQRRRLRGVLGEHGFSVVESPTPQAALGIMKEASFDAVIVKDEARQLALRGLCAQLQKQAPAPRLFVLLQSASEKEQILAAAGGAATLVPEDASNEDVASLLKDCFVEKERRLPSFTPPARPSATPAPAISIPPMAEPSEPVEPVQLIDRSRLWELHLAKRNGSDEPLMLERLSDQAPQDPELLAALSRMTRVIRKIDHPNLPKVVEVGPADRPYVVMEHVPGLTLQQLRRRLYDADRWFDPATAAFIIGEILSALEAVHDAKLTHGALSPTAIWLTTDGQVKVLHTGTGSIIRSIERQMVRSASSTALPDPYVAPEQVQDGMIDSRTDLFVAGALLYELLSGDPLFLKDDAFHTMDAIVACEVPDLDRSIPASLASVTRSFLEKDPDRRPKSAAAARSALSAAAAAPGKDDRRTGLLKKLFVPKKQPHGPVDPKAELIELVALREP